MDAGKELGTWSKYGLDPEWVFIPGRPVIAADYKGLIENEITVGFAAGADPLIARANGVAVKMVAGHVGLNTVTNLCKE